MNATARSTAMRKSFDASARVLALPAFETEEES